MRATTFIRLLFIVLTLAAGTLAVDELQAEERRPNVILILVDDLGAHDLACYGSDLHETPHLD
ncbi:MAG: sulfatase, partial [Planctomyces sp.]|nr:sulfatase [Planctomyces sp.]